MRAGSMHGQRRTVARATAAGARLRAGIAAALLAALAAGCGGSSARRSRDGDDDSGSPARPADGGSQGMGSAGRGGSGGTSGGAGGAGGSAGSGLFDAGVVGGAADAAPATPADAGGPGRDAGAGADAAAAPSCAVTILPVAPPSLMDLPVGVSLVVRAQVSNYAGDGPPSFRWTVSYQNRELMPMRDADPAVIQIPSLQAGLYTIRAEVSPTCFATVVASALPAAERQSTFWVRVTPPPGRQLPAIETTATLRAGRPMVMDLPLAGGSMVAVDPQNARSQGLPSYVRIFSPRSSLRVEGHTKDNAVRAFLNPLQRYDILVVPDSAGIAPALFKDLTPAQIRATPFTIEEGVRVDVRIADGTNRPVAGARLLLRAGALPSTLGLTDAMGRTLLRAQRGAYGALVLPPEDAPLPEARIGEVLSLVDTAETVTFTWRPLPTTRVTVNVPQAAATSVVRLTSLDGELPNVGALTLDAASFTAAGAVRQERPVDGGMAVFTVPRARYRALILPAGGAEGAVAAVEIDARGAGPVTASLPMPTPVRVSGRIAPPAGGMLPAGLRIEATDSELAGATVSTVVGADGRYQLDLNPARSYRLFLDPPSETGLPRAPLGLVAVRTEATQVRDHVLAAGLALTGVVQVDGVAVSDAVVQAYCVGAVPDCVDPNAPNTDNTRPLAATVSGPNGSYRLLLPDPATSTF